MNTPANLVNHLLLTDFVFSLSSTWRLEAPIEAVWEAIVQKEAWPQWWAQMRHVHTLMPGDTGGLGALRRFHCRSPMGLTFDARVTMLQAPFAMDSEISGDLTGWGRWRLFRSGGVTLLRHQWDVLPTKPWMRRLAPYARALFEWSHARTMVSGERGLRQYLRSDTPESMRQ